MQIRIEIDVKPEELRRFLGLPDVAGVQEEFINFLRDKIVEANESFDAAAFVRANFDSFKKNVPFRRLLDTVRHREQDASPPATKKPARKAAPRPARPAGAGKKAATQRRKAVKKTATPKPDGSADSGA